jgi:hypothetical protein
MNDAGRNERDQSTGFEGESQSDVDERAMRPDLCPTCEEVEVSAPGQECAECLLQSGYCPVGHALDEDDRCATCAAEEAADWAMEREREERI